MRLEKLTAYLSVEVRCVSEGRAFRELDLHVNRKKNDQVNQSFSIFNPARWAVILACRSHESISRKS